MEIGERDLFNYIFYRNLLEKEKAEYLETTNKFDEELGFFLSLKDAYSEELQTEFKQEIAEKIPAYKISNVIELYAEKKRGKGKDTRLKLAADSAELSQHNSSQTFSDKNKNYLVKLISSEEKTKIFVFSTKDKLLNNVDIIIEPQNLKLHMDNNSKPLELNEIGNIQKIKLEFLNAELNE